MTSRWMQAVTQGSWLDVRGISRNTDLLVSSLAFKSQCCLNSILNVTTCCLFIGESLFLINSKSNPGNQLCLTCMGGVGGR